MSQVIYVRAPDSLKDAVDDYADRRGTTLTSGVVDLLERGLAATTDERSITRLEASLAKATAQRAELEGKLAAASSELAALRAFAQRAQQAVGTCPSCREPITGYELLAVGRCEHCHSPLMNLLAPKGQKTGLDDRELGLLLGALGVALIGAAILGSSST